MSSLVAGQNVHLGSDQAGVTVTGPVDLSVLVCGDTHKVASDDDMYFYNRPSGPGVRVHDSAVSLTLTSLRPGADRLVIVASPADQVSTFGALPAVQVTIDGGAAEWTFTPTGLYLETCLLLCEIYRHQGAWKVRAIGQGYANGLAGVATDYGITIDPYPLAPAAQLPPPPPVPVPTQPPIAAPAVNGPTSPGRSRYDEHQQPPNQAPAAGIDADPARQSRARELAVALADACRQASAVYDEIIEHVQRWDRARSLANADYVHGIRQHPSSKQTFAQMAQRAENETIPRLHQLRGIAAHGNALRSDLFVVIGGPTGDFRTTADWLSRNDLPDGTAAAVIAQGIFISVDFGVTLETFLAENERMSEILSR